MAPATEIVKLHEATGRVCAENIKSTRAIPPRNISAMDGYAVRSADIKDATPANPVKLKLKGSLGPEVLSKRLPQVNSMEAYYVLTGGPIPNGADCVARIERALVEGESIFIRRSFPTGTDISLTGEDIKVGSEVCRKGQLLNPPMVSLLMGVGRKSIQAYKKPAIGILSVGDELQEYSNDSTGAAANNYAYLISGFVNELEAKEVVLGISGDDTSQIKKKVSRGLQSCDAVITIAGSSVGKADRTCSSIVSMPMAELIFHGVRAVPIRPAGLATVRRKPVIMLPGHSVSATLGFFLIALPIINGLSGLDVDARRVRVNANCVGAASNQRGLPSLELVTVSKDAESGEYSFIPFGWGSNLLSTLSNSNGFIWLQPRQEIREGQECSVELFGAFEMSRVQSSTK